jgi:hypothetical protein
MEGRIKEVEAEDALKISMTGQEEYEARKEREDAEAMVKNHRENAKNSLDTAKAFRKQATAGTQAGSGLILDTRVETPYGYHGNLCE